MTNPTASKHVAPPPATLIARLRWQDVDSSNIAAMAWHPTDALTTGLRLGWMVVRFHNGAEYAYQDVPEPIYDAVLDAASIGQAFNRLVREAGSFCALPEGKESKDE